MLVTIPKSGSLYLAEVLRQGLNIPYKEVSSGYFPLDVFEYRKLNAYSTGKVISKAHLGANPINLHLMKAFSPRIVLHLRDPRQAMLSMLHHLKRDFEDDPHYLAWVAPAPSREILRGSLSEAIDWYLAHHLTNLLEWTESWLAHAESGEKPSVLVTHYHDLRENVQTVVERILNFYQIPPRAYVAKEVPKDWATHYRKGELEEWREVFNPTQQKICADLMGGFPRVNQLYGEKTGVRNNLPASTVTAPTGRAAYETSTSR
jgi:hypothetical protein